MRFTQKIMWMALVALFFAGNAIAQKTITPEIIAGIEYVTEVQVSPDGQKIAYVHRIPGGETDKPGERWYELHIMDRNGQNDRVYVGKPHSANHISWSKDGSKVYFMAHREDYSDGYQLYAIDLHGGEAMPVTKESQRIVDYHFSPDGSKLGMILADGKSDDEKSEAKVGKDWVVYGEDYKYNRLYVHNLASGKTEQVFQDNLHVTAFTWAPDNKTMVFTASENPETDFVYMFQKIYKVAGVGSKPAVLVETAGKLGDIAISPDGKTFAWAGAVDISDPLPQSLFIVPMSGGTAKNLTEKYEGSVASLQWLADGEILLHTAEGCHNMLYRVYTQNGNREKIYGPGIIFRSASIHRASNFLAAIGHNPEYPNEVVTGNLKTGDFKRMTFNNAALKDVKMGKQEVISWKGAGGWNIEGIITYPPNYEKGKRYPLLLQIHGGPEGVSLNGFNTRAVYPVQWYAANGYVVLEPNYRGSQGRGVAFAKGDHKDLAGTEFEDVLKGIDHLVKEGIVDNDKVATGGFSYGGYFSAWAATKHSDRFKAAMMGAGISNWISFSGTTDIIWENSLVHWNLWWYDNFKLVWDRSPMAHINNAKTPTLIVHGERDERVPISQGLELYNALKLKKVPTQMVMYKRQPHGINEYNAQIDYMNRTLKWFDTYTK